MLTGADDYPVHQTPDPIAFAGSERNFYDRYFFNGYAADGDLFFAAALGVYPNLNIMDAAFAVRIGERQYNLRTSRHLDGDRMQTQVGPVRIDVLEPLRRLRIVVEDNAHGISADVVFTGRQVPIEEPRSIRRHGPRVLQDLTRMTQLGRYSGWINAGGHRVVLEERSTQGVRDRSWGIRAVGERDPQPMAPAREQQFHWIWIPASLEDRSFLFYLNEDSRGVAWNRGMTIVYDNGLLEHLPNAMIEIAYHPGTRWPRHGTIRVPSGDGDYTIDITPGARFHMAGIGYMDPEWSHGVNKGALAIGYDEYGPDQYRDYKPPFTYTQAFARVTMKLPDGSTQHGQASFEALSFGPHARLGFVGTNDAP